MEIEGHPTEDLIEELERRGAVRVVGSAAGPRVDAIRFLSERFDDTPGTWLFLTAETFRTGFDELP